MYNYAVDTEYTLNQVVDLTMIDLSGYLEYTSAIAGRKHLIKGAPPGSISPTARVT